jgi:TonB family protein
MKKGKWVLALVAANAMSVWGQSATPAPDGNGVYPVVGSVKAARLMHAVPARVSGDVAALQRITALLVVVGADGNPTTIKVENEKASPLDDAALEAVRHSEFAAGSFEGKPVATRLMVWVPFLGNDNPAIPVAGTVRTVKGLKLPVPISTPEAEFSDEARRKGVNGNVVIQMLVTEEGTPAQVEVVASAGYGLDEQALKATRRYTFKPASLDGVPVPWFMPVEINFTLLRR